MADSSSTGDSTSSALSRTHICQSEAYLAFPWVNGVMLSEQSKDNAIAKLWEAKGESESEGMTVSRGEDEDGPSIQSLRVCQISFDGCYLTRFIHSRFWRNAWTISM